MYQKPKGSGNLRDHLANERTLLAWIRTSVTLIALGFVVAKFGILLREVGGAQAAAFTARAGAAVGVVLVLGGCSLAILATLKFLRLRRMIEQEAVVFSPTLDLALSAIITVASLILALYIVLTA